MENAAQKLDWALVEVFLAVADTGSLSEAARQLGTSQPTVGRQIRQIEDQLQVSLFHRHARGLQLTEAGAALRPHARAMREAAFALGLAAAGQSDQMSGTVRITASEAASVYHLPAIIAQLRQDAPEISVELVPSDTSENLLFREADIAVRMFRSEQLDIITKYLGEITLGMFAAESYVARKGIPQGFEDLAHHDLVGYDRSTAIIDGMRELGFPATREMFGVRCDDNIAYWELIRAGCGIGFGQECLGQQDPALVQLPTDFPMPTIPVWLAAHEAMRHTPRIRRVWEALEASLMPLITRPH